MIFLKAATDRKKTQLRLLTPPACSQQDYWARLRKVNLIARFASYVMIYINTNRNQKCYRLCSI